MRVGCGRCRDGAGRCSHSRLPFPAPVPGSRSRFPFPVPVPGSRSRFASPRPVPPRAAPPAPPHVTLAAAPLGSAPAAAPDEPWARRGAGGRRRRAPRRGRRQQHGRGPLQLPAAPQDGGGLHPLPQRARGAGPGRALPPHPAAPVRRLLDRGHQPPAGRGGPARRPARRPRQARGQPHGADLPQALPGQGALQLLLAGRRPGPPRPVAQVRRAGAAPPAAAHPLPHAARRGARRPPRRAPQRGADGQAAVRGPQRGALLPRALPQGLPPHRGLRRARPEQQVQVRRHLPEAGPDLGGGALRHHGGEPGLRGVPRAAGAARAAAGLQGVPRRPRRHARADGQRVRLLPLPRQGDHVPRVHQAALHRGRRAAAAAQAPHRQRHRGRGLPGREHPLRARHDRLQLPARLRGGAAGAAPRAGHPLQGLGHGAGRRALLRAAAAGPGRVQEGPRVPGVPAGQAHQRRVRVLPRRQVRQAGGADAGGAAGDAARGAARAQPGHAGAGPRRGARGQRRRRRRQLLRVLQVAAGAREPAGPPRQRHRHRHRGGGPAGARQEPHAEAPGAAGLAPQQRHRHREHPGGAGAEGQPARRRRARLARLLRAELARDAHGQEQGREAGAAAGLLALVVQRQQLRQRRRGARGGGRGGAPLARGASPRRPRLQHVAGGQPEHHQQRQLPRRPALAPPARRAPLPRDQDPAGAAAAGRGLLVFLAGGPGPPFGRPPLPATPHQDTKPSPPVPAPPPPIPAAFRGPPHPQGRRHCQTICPASTKTLRFPPKTGAMVLPPPPPPPPPAERSAPPSPAGPRCRCRCSMYKIKVYLLLPYGAGGTLGCPPPPPPRPFPAGGSGRRQK